MFTTRVLCSHYWSASTINRHSSRRLFLFRCLLVLRAMPLSIDPLLSLINLLPSRPVVLHFESWWLVVCIRPGMISARMISGYSPHRTLSGELAMQIPFTKGGDMIAYLLPSCPQVNLSKERSCPVPSIPSCPFLASHPIACFRPVDTLQFAM
jgi:hypothetical protein